MSGSFSLMSEIWSGIFFIGKVLLNVLIAIAM